MRVIDPEAAFQHLQVLTASPVVGPEFTNEHIDLLKGSISKRFAERVLSWHDVQIKHDKIIQIYSEDGDMRNSVRNAEDALASAASLRRQVLAESDDDPFPKPTGAQLNLRHIRSHLDELQKAYTNCPAMSGSHFPHLSEASARKGTSGLLRGAQLGAHNNRHQH